MAILDRFKVSRGPWPAKNVYDPPRFAITVTPSDSTDLPNGVACSLDIGGAGDVVVTLADMDDGTHVTYAGRTAASTLLGQVKRVWSTGTTATNILALY